MRFIASVGDDNVLVAIEDDGPLRHVTLNERTLSVGWQAVGVDAAATPDDAARAVQYSALVGTRSYDVYVRPVPAEDAGDAQTYEITIGGRPYRVSVQDERTRVLSSLAGGSHVTGEIAIRAPMPGLVSNVLAAEGETVSRGATIVVLEAMKMENDLTTPRAGIVKALRVARGQTVNQGDVLAVVGDEAGAAPVADDTDDL